MASNSRGILLLGALLLVAAMAGISTTSGTGWIIPMSLLLSGIFVILVFSFLTITKETERGSTPVATSKGRSQETIESQVEDLPDPNNSGIDLPIM